MFVRFKKKSALLVLSVLFSSSAYSLTLDEALTAAYQNNDDLKNAREDFKKEVEAFPSALAEFMPRVSASMNASNVKAKDLTGRSQDNHSYSRSAQLQQSIFNGGSSVARLKQAQSGFMSSLGKFYSQEQDILLKAIESYLLCYSWQEKYDISDLSLKLNQKQLEAVEAQFKLGEATETDVSAARAALAAAETRKLQAYAKLQEYNANFIRVFGVEPTNISMPQPPADLPKSFEELLAKAKQSNYGIYFRKNQIQSAKAAEYATKGDLLPKVDFSISATHGYQDMPITIQPNSANQRNVQSSLSMTVPIFAQGGAEYSKIRRAKCETRSAVISYDIQMKSTIASCSTIWENFHASRAQIESSIRSVESATSAYNGTVAEESLGSKTIIDVLNSETKLNDAKVSNVESNSNYILSAYQMKSLTGELTAKTLKLPVKYFSPESEFRKIKTKLVGY